MDPIDRSDHQYLAMLAAILAGMFTATRGGQAQQRAVVNDAFEAADYAYTTLQEKQKPPESAPAPAPTPEPPAAPSTPPPPPPDVPTTKK